LGWPTTCNKFILGGFLKKPLFDLFFSNLFYKPTNPILRPATFLFALHFWWAQHSSVKCF
jgi:hypothetical protein